MKLRDPLNFKIRDFCTLTLLFKVEYEKHCVFLSSPFFTAKSEQKARLIFLLRIHFMWTILVDVFPYRTSDVRTHFLDMGPLFEDSDIDLGMVQVPNLWIPSIL